MWFYPVAAVLWLAAGALPAFAQEGRKPAGKDPFNDIEPSVLKIDVPTLIHLRSPEDVARARKELIAFIWKNDGRLPAASHVERVDMDLTKGYAAMGMASCEKITIDMKKGFKSTVYHFRPKAPNKRLAIFHQGHSDLWEGGAVQTVTFFLARGFSVMAIQMPLVGDNKGLAPPKIRSHDDMAKLISRDLEPIRFFVEPVAIALNYALKKFAYEDVVMIGISGGGWTTTLYAAIDTRVRLSFPVAGTLPEYLRVGGRDRGDWEQEYPALYKVANYLDLYVLGSSGPGRKQRQVLNKYDSCCFSGVRYRTYEKHVRVAVAATGKGAFDVYLDESHRSHLISRHALEKAIGPLLDEPRK